jgi:hypothetical protein
MRASAACALGEALRGVDGDEGVQPRVEASMRSRKSA